MPSLDLSQRLYKRESKNGKDGKGNGKGKGKDDDDREEKEQKIQNDRRNRLDQLLARMRAAALATRRAPQTVNPPKNPPPAVNPVPAPAPAPAPAPVPVPAPAPVPVPAAPAPVRVIAPPPVSNSIIVSTNSNSGVSNPPPATPAAPATPITANPENVEVSSKVLENASSDVSIDSIQDSIPFESTGESTGESTNISNLPNPGPSNGNENFDSLDVPSSGGANSALPIGISLGVIAMFLLFFLFYARKRQNNAAKKEARLAAKERYEVMMANTAIPGAEPKTPVLSLLPQKPFTVFHRLSALFALQKQSDIENADENSGPYGDLAPLKVDVAQIESPSQALSFETGQIHGSDQIDSRNMSRYKTNSIRSLRTASILSEQSSSDQVTDSSLTKMINQNRP